MSTHLADRARRRERIWDRIGWAAAALGIMVFLLVPFGPAWWAALIPAVAVSLAALMAGAYYAGMRKAYETIIERERELVG